MTEEELRKIYEKEQLKWKKAVANGSVKGNFVPFEEFVEATGIFLDEDEDALSEENSIIERETNRGNPWHDEKGRFTTGPSASYLESLSLPERKSLASKYLTNLVNANLKKAGFGAKSDQSAEDIQKTHEKYLADRQTIYKTCIGADNVTDKGYYTFTDGDGRKQVLYCDGDFNNQSLKQTYSLMGYKSQTSDDNAFVEKFEKMPKSERNKAKISQREAIRMLPADSTLNGITKAEERVIKTYTYATPQNSALRKGKTLSEIPSAQILNNVINRTNGKAGTYYRGIPESVGKSIFANIKVGSVITDKGFVSTDSQKSIARKFAGDNGYIITIKSSGGAGKSINTSSYSMHSEENETLFNCNLPMKVVSIKGNQIEVEV